MHPERTVQIDFRAPHLVYPFTKQLSDRRKPFRAVFAYNNHSASSAIRAFREHGWRVAEEPFSLPALTTYRRRLWHAGSDGR
jgi:DNA-binding LacI/PurR family transcriptional regulator